MTATYDFARIEPKWQQYWFNHKTFAAADPGASGANKPKYYVLDMFPYPSGAGLHVGHPEGYTATDIIARHKRSLGFNVLHPIGWDAFGLPAEQYAVKTNQHPREATAANINNFRRQIQMLGFSYDWDREVDTTDPNYFRWTQWIFLQIYNSWFDHALQKARPIAELIEELDSDKRPLSCYNMQGTFSQLDDTAKRKLIDSHRLAYQAEVPVNWCPQLGTVLANEEVIDGKSEVGGFPVERKPMRQWMLRITAYAERLLKDLEQLDWPEPIKQQQRNWIGRSEGSEVRFALADDPDQSIVVFTTRPDTLFGATYMVIAPEHALVGQITTPQQRGPVEQYCKQAAAKSDLDRTDLAKEKTGVFTGAHAINPANQERIQIWIADYVLISYGTGAIMAVPAHDQRDFEFASKFRLAIRQVVQPPTDAKGETDKAFVGDGVAINSGSYDGLTTAQFKEKIVEVLANAREGKAAINYKLRDWLFSRQRYWGEPFPLLHDDQGNVIALEDGDLPVTLPQLNDFRPTGDGEPPLARAKDWIQVNRNGQTFSRETNTMPQWAGSCWYYLRYIDPKNDQKMIDPQKEQYWMQSKKPDGTAHIGGVDLYIGGVEHAVLHLLYARFWHKVLYDLGHVSTPEPFGKLFNQGLILGEDNQKMSKSRGNVINPDDVVKQYGSDSLRLYEMFMGPLEQVKPWSIHGVEGVYRFCQRVWRLIVDEENDAIQPGISDSDNEDLERALHKTIKKVGGDIDRFAFNTAISAMMEFVNEAYRTDSIGKSQAQRFLVILAPFAPHLCEELWQRLGHDETLAYEPWPKFDEALTVDEEVEIAIQITGKVRGKITVASDADETAIREAALAEPRVAELLKGKTIKKVIVVKGRLVNIVAG